MDQTHTAPAVIEPQELLGFSVANLPPGLAVMFDQRLFDRVQQIATMLSKAQGFTPTHLIDKPEACFAVVTRSLTWRLDPWAVACATYQTPGGRVGYEGKLCQAILENSGKLEGPVQYQHFGDWSKVAGKYEVKAGGQYGKEFAQRSWTRKDAEGLGVTVIAKVRGEPKQREWTFLLDQAFPLNSTLWATDPRSQICYTAVRRFASLAAPGLFMGVPFDREDEIEGSTAEPRDITPAQAAKPVPGAKLAKLVEQRKAAAAPAKAEPEVAAQPEHDEDGVVHEPDREAVRAADMPADLRVDRDRTIADTEQRGLAEPPLVADDETVELVLSSKEPSLQIMASVASDRLLRAGQEKTGKGGLAWVEAALSHNPWIAGHAPTREGIEELRATFAKAVAGK